MTQEQREKAIKTIQSAVPNTVFERFCTVLTQVEERNKDPLTLALARILYDSSDGFYYNMRAEEFIDTITPIREILDLFEGWFITSSPKIGDKPIWEIKAITERK